MKVYLIHIDSCVELKDFENLYPILDIKTRKKISRLFNKNDKVRSLLGNVFLKYLLSRELNCKLSELEISYGKYGKPLLSKNSWLSFNISHSNEFIAIAISDRNIGIDIEKNIDLDYEELAMSFFTKQEYNYISTSPNVKESFFKIWTLKESYLKAIGTGLHTPLNSFYFSLQDDNEIILLHKDCDNEKFYFHNVVIQNNYHLSVCSTKEIKDLKIQKYNQVELKKLLLGGN
ncbi:4'-phosphopantetheinyl transferase superfamily protein [Oceanobacillus sp. AG]|uniref:4'-phosphopantetheinyl transferase family protein n=1 Tax=Oceanobacillus sp. AG TaxID=2681969 RepID=UPI0012EB4807|nr:4'-phosphopantetheinyl transferase superfamily protein [Oceanobacillus sp. AG]